MWKTLKKRDLMIIKIKNDDELQKKGKRSGNERKKGKRFK